MGKERKGINPADAFRKEQRKKELKKLKKERDELREVRSMLNNPAKIDEEIARVQKESNESKLDKGLKDRIVELKRMKEVALQKEQIAAAYGRPTSSSTASSAAPAASSSSAQHPGHHQSQHYPPHQPPQPQLHASIHPSHIAPPYNTLGMPTVPPPPPGAMMPIAGQAQTTAWPVHLAPYVGAAPYPMVPQVAVAGVSGVSYPLQRPFAPYPIPPPPPPRPPQARPAAPPPRGHHKARREAASTGDPLDPGAAGYADHTYGREKSAPRPPPRPAAPASRYPDMPSYLPAPTLAIPQPPPPEPSAPTEEACPKPEHEGKAVPPEDLPEDNEEEDNEEEEEDNEEEEEEEEEDDEDGVLGPALPSLSGHTGMSEEDDDVLGPVLPPMHRASFCPAAFQDTGEDEDAEQEGDVLGPVLPPLPSAQLAPLELLAEPPLPGPSLPTPSPSTPSKPVSVTSLFAAYEDDDGSVSGDSDGEAPPPLHTETHAPMNTAVDSEDTGPASLVPEGPVLGPARPMHVSPAASESSLPAHSGPAHDRPALSEEDEACRKKPKVHTVDAAVKSLVPTVLRRKKGAFPPRPPTGPPPAVPPSAAAVAKPDVQPSEANAKEDDAYLQFMSEMQALEGV